MVTGLNLGRRVRVPGAFVDLSVTIPDSQGVVSNPFLSGLRARLENQLKRLEMGLPEQAREDYKNKRSGLYYTLTV